MIANDIFVFAFSENGGQICAYRSNKRYRTLSLEELDVPQNDIDFIVKNLRTSSDYPLLVRLGDKPFIISCAHYPSSELCFGVVANAPLSLAKKLFCDLYGDSCIAPSFSSVVKSKRESETGRQELLRVLSFVCEFGKKRGVMRQTDLQSAERASKNAVCLAEKFIGCVSKINLVFGTNETFDYDISLFSMFALCSLLFAYDKALSRNATLDFAELSGKLYSAFSFELDENAEYENNFDVLDSHMETLGMYFALFSKGRKIRVEACAIRLDLSLIGLKNNPVFKFEELE